MTIEGIFGLITVLILGVAGVRDLLAKFELAPENWKKFARWVYGSYDKELTYKVLKEMGFSVEEVRGAVSNLTLSKETAILNRIICLCINYLVYFPEKMKYGQESVVESHYYISPMEAAHDEEDRRIMAQGIVDIYVKNRKKMPDFIITPKKGNPFLSLELGSRHKIITILTKSSNEGSYVKGAPIEKLDVNFEGIRQLTEKTENRRYRGIAVDCNGSGCRGLKEAIRKFNEVICGKYPHIDRITEAVILFRPDNTIDIDRDDDIRIYRYFDLTEEIKAEMHQIQSKTADKIVYNDTRFSDDIKSLKSLMEKEGLIKIKE
jgi:hypothetical protein